MKNEKESIQIILDSLEHARAELLNILQDSNKLSYEIALDEINFAILDIKYNRLKSHASK